MPDTALTKERLNPFDRTYARVTERMRGVASGLRDDERAWLERLIVAFAVERDVWNQRPELEPYRRRWGRLRTRFLWLAAGAYLHISFDLSRALADEWPGEAAWSEGPTKLRGEVIYFDLEDLFVESTARAARDHRVVGWLTAILSLFPGGMLKLLAGWMLELRRAAWMHADVLASQTDRPRRERAMAQAMAAALEDTSDLRPWSISALRPPDAVLRSPAWIASVASLFSFASLNDTLVMVAMSITAGIAVAQIHHLIWQLSDRSYEFTSFIEDFGARVRSYLDVAVFEPDRLDGFLAEVRATAGLAPRQDFDASPQAST